MPGQAIISVSVDVPQKTWGLIKLKVTLDYLEELLNIESILKGEFTAQDRLMGRFARQRRMYHDLLNPPQMFEYGLGIIGGPTDWRGWEGRIEPEKEQGQMMDWPKP
jgi:hypothetical protein